MSEITLAQGKGGFPAKHGLGLFQNRVTTELGFEQTDQKPRRLTMTTRIRTAPIIYIAKEFAEDSCAYNVILGHEQLHQLFDLEVLRAMPDEIRSITQTVFPPDELGCNIRVKAPRGRSNVCCARIETATALVQISVAWCEGESRKIGFSWFLLAFQPVN